VYQLASYDHWRQQLGRDDFEFGQFGENFTVEGLPDNEVCVGDRYEIGGALFEVSQPRVTCYRVGLRLGEPRLPSLLVAHRRPGFYMRVLREGVVEAGAQIIKVWADPEGMTVADVDALLYLPGHDRAEVAHALRVAALSPGWQSSFEALLATEADATGNPGLSDVAAPVAWSGFRWMRVVEVVSESAAVVSLRLAATDNQPLAAALPGQFVAVRLQRGGGGAPVSRSFSLSGAPGSSDYRISVKREPGGVASEIVHSRLRAGDRVEVAAPRGQFTLDPGPAPVLLLSAGIGVTPVLSMLHALADAASSREVWWLHGARNGTEHPFAAEVRGLLSRLPNARAHVCYSAPTSTDEQGRDYTHCGRLGQEFLTTLPLPDDAHAYVCGPATFMTDVQAALTHLGMDAAHIHTEVFGAGTALTPGIAKGTVTPPHPPEGELGTGPSVTFTRSGITARWRDDYISLLEFAEACDVPTRWSCRTGVCHTCEVGVLAGAVTYDPSPVDMPAADNVLICCAVPLDEVVIDL
jgi:ferredoxin-NADP reductase/MOSC domain-containing protein YiiM